MHGIEILDLVNNLQQKLILNYLYWKPTVVLPKSNLKRHILQLLFFEKKYSIFGEQTTWKQDFTVLLWQKEQAE